MNVKTIMHGDSEAISARALGKLIQTNNLINQQEATRESQEADREADTALAISNTNAATSAANTAASNATSAATNANSVTSTVQSNETTRQNYYNAYKVFETYNNATTYYLANKVSHSGSTFQCIVTSTVGNSPNSDGTDNTYWKCIAKKGNDGAGGDMFKNVYDTGNKGTDFYNYADNKIVVSNQDTVGTGILSGTGIVSAQSTPNMTVAASAVTAYLPDGKRYTASAISSQTITTANSTNPRKDIIYTNSSGATTYLVGTAASSPTAPSLPSGGTLLAEIYVGAGVTSITSANITDKRTIIQSNADLVVAVSGVNTQLNNKVTKGELVLNIKDFGAIGNGISDDTSALQAARDYIAGLSKKVTLVFPAGTYKYTHSPNWAISNITLVGLGEVIMNCTETDGIVMNFDSYNSSSPNTSPIVFCVSALNFILDGVNCLVGLYNRNVAHSTFDIKVRNLKSTGVDFASRSKAFYILHGVCNVYKSPTCSINEYNFTSKPFYGIVLDDASSNGTRVATCNRFENSIIEGLGLAGIYLQAGDFNVFDGGTSEANANYGISISSNSKGNKFIGMGFESNPTADFEDVGKGNTFENCYSQTLGSLYGINSKIVGGFYQSITLGSGASDCVVEGAVYDYFNPGSGTLTNSGLLSTIINTRTFAGVHYQDLISGALIPKSSYQTNMSALTVGASPYTYTNANNYPIDVLIRGGTISGLTFTRQGNPTTIPTSIALIQLSPNDSIRVTYSAVPEMILIPR